MGEGPTGGIEMAFVVIIRNKSKPKQIAIKFFDPNFLSRKFGGVWGKAPNIINQALGKVPYIINKSKGLL